jgi:hypothetical protein
MTEPTLFHDITPAALLSSDQRYRYWLTRDWARHGGRRCTFVMLNPSTADATQDDPTIRRCIGFARALGYGGLMVVNLYALRATKPEVLWRADYDERVGADNDSELRRALRDAAERDAHVIGGWGANAEARRVAEVMALPHAERLTALGTTKAGQPRHPLYLRADSTPTRWGAPR